MRTVISSASAMNYSAVAENKKKAANSFLTGVHGPASGELAEARRHRSHHHHHHHHCQLPPVSGKRRCQGAVQGGAFILAEDHDVFKEITLDGRTAHAGVKQSRNKPRFFFSWTQKITSVTRVRWNLQKCSFCPVSLVPFGRLSDDNKEKLTRNMAVSKMTFLWKQEI